MKGKKTALIILDGWGHGDKTMSDAIHQANTPFIDSLYNKYPNSELLTHGKHVGLPEGQMGNSEVGHLNIGSGRIVHQDLAKINIACETNDISKKNGLKHAFSTVKKNKGDLHIMGLVSDGGIHSHQNHLYKLCELSRNEGIENVFIHAFTDGRDCDPKSGKKFIADLEKNLHGAKIASLCGRYYAMDRDKRWERIKEAYDLMVKGLGQKTRNLQESVEESYQNNTTDEFIKPIVCVNENDKPIGTIKNGDSIICFNFRTDRCRQITQVLTQKDMKDLEMKTLNLHYTTMTNYDNSFNNINVIYEKENLKNTIGEVISENNLSQIRIAETEKYPHVTFFFSGGREKEFKKEKRIMINSPKVPTYDLHPEMSAKEVTSDMMKELKRKEADFICLNFANPDMVGHTGNYNAIINAVETVDKCTKKIIECGIENDYAFIVIADHGNADIARNNDGSPNTAHTTNPVPCFLINTDYTNIKDGILADIAPTILNIMGINIPQEMTGKILTK